MAAVQVGNLKKLKGIIDDYGLDNIDFTAVHGHSSTIQIDDTLSFTTDLYTPVLLALTCNKLDIARYLLEELQLSLPLYLHKPRDSNEI